MESLFSRALKTACGFAVLFQLLGTASGAVGSNELAKTDFFEKHIRPVLVESCYECHSARSEKLRGGLMLDTRDGLLKGGDSGPAIVVGNPEKSLLLQTMRHETKDADLHMPPKKDKLSDAVLSDFENWIRMGAPDPRTEKAVAKTVWDAEKAASHWAFKVPAKVNVPEVAAMSTFPLVNEIDRFVLAKLKEQKLVPTPRADRATLVRRLSFDLTGLPPSAEEVKAFVSDDSADAYEKLVDRLLASPAYGERWARHWLDIARYADTSGDRANQRKSTPVFSNGWTYRDYVIDAFNKDTPYDRFIVEQIAADRLPESKENPRLLAAMGFLTLGKRFMGNENDVLDDRIDVVTKGLMGLTGACARCHDHKFDPVSTRDYYALHGVFSSSEEQIPGPLLEDPEKHPKYGDYKAELAKIQKELDDYTAGESVRLAAGMLERTGDYLLLAHQTAKTTDTSKKGGNFRLAARDRGLKAEIAQSSLERLREIETANSKKPDSIFAPWFALAALPAEGFAEKCREVLGQLGEGGVVNRDILSALNEAASGSLEDVAKVYNKIFERLHKALGFTEFETRGRSGGGALAKAAKPLDDAVLEALRKAVVATDGLMLPSETTTARTLGAVFNNAQAAIRARMASLDLTHEGAPVRAMSMIDRANPRNSAVLIRGEATNKGPVVPRRWLSLFGGQDSQPFKDGSGRLEMARSVASRDNPLTARVFVNRVWQWHFGQGIVRTVSDFGTRSEEPSHPEMLDWLAGWFMDHGWSTKQLHKLIVLSSTYCQDSKPNDSGMAVDPTNQYLWRANVQRLDFEQMRDALLTVGARLDLEQRGGRPFSLVDEAATSSSGVTLKKRQALDPKALTASKDRRTVYALIDRSRLPEMFNTFDFANPEISTGERVLTTVPQQALFMMNSPFMAEQVRALVTRKDFPKAARDDDKVRFVFQNVLQREPSAAEVEAARAFLNAAPEALVETNALVDAVEAGEGKRKAGVAVAQGRPLTPFERYAQVVLLTNEFMYIR
jgi:cytochrome c553